MKELTIQDKAELYDKALKQIKECTPDENGFVTIYPKEIFPELNVTEDELMKIDLIDYFEELPDLICNGEHIEGSYRGHYKKDIIAWLEKQGNKDEEILILKDQIESLHAAIKALKEAHKIEIEKQGEQNPTWSEYDEVMLHSIISDFKGFKHDNTSSLEPHFDNAIDWIKSLKDRYTWKPTEEQINAIKLARNSFVRNDSSGYSFINKILFKLENQLKKMMEE